MRELLESKKAKVTAIGMVLVTILGAVLPILGISEELTTASQDFVQAATALIAIIVATYNIGQGIADHGKERAKVERSAGATKPISGSSLYYRVGQPEKDE